MNTNVLKPAQWSSIFTLLSLDNMAALYGAMGLSLSPEKFQPVLRKIILEYRRTYEKQPQRMPPLADRVLDGTASSVGGQLANHLYLWSTTVFLETHADQPQWSAWEILIGYSPLLQRLNNRGALTLARFQSIKEMFDTSMDISEAEELVAESKKRPFSAWDLEMYAMHNYSPDDLSDPFSLALRIVEMNNFQVFWENYVTGAPGSEKEALWDEGQVVVKERGIWMPGPLERPDRLRRRV